MTPVMFFFGGGTPLSDWPRREISGVYEADNCIKRTAVPREWALEEEKSNSYSRQKDHCGSITEVRD